jgi:hypothetical protein
MGGRIVISPTARGAGAFAAADAANSLRTGLRSRRWCIAGGWWRRPAWASPRVRWVWQVTGWRERARVVEEVAAALARDDPAPRPGNAKLVEHLPPPGRPPSR